MQLNMAVTGGERNGRKSILIHKVTGSTAVTLKEINPEKLESIWPNLASVGARVYMHVLLYVLRTCM